MAPFSLLDGFFSFLSFFFPFPSEGAAVRSSCKPAQTRHDQHSDRSAAFALSLGAWRLLLRSAKMGDSLPPFLAALAAPVPDPGLAGCLLWALAALAPLFLLLLFWRGWAGGGYPLTLEGLLAPPRPRPRRRWSEKPRELPGSMPIIPAIMACMNSSMSSSSISSSLPPSSSSSSSPSPAHRNETHRLSPLRRGASRGAVR